MLFDTQDHCSSHPVIQTVYSALSMKPSNLPWKTNLVFFFNVAWASLKLFFSKLPQPIFRIPVQWSIHLKPHLFSSCLRPESFRNLHVFLWSHFQSVLTVFGIRGNGTDKNHHSVMSPNTKLYHKQTLFKKSLANHSHVPLWLARLPQIQKLMWKHWPLARSFSEHFHMMAWYVLCCKVSIAVNSMYKCISPTIWWGINMIRATASDYFLVS